MPITNNLEIQRERDSKDTKKFEKELAERTVAEYISRTVREAELDKKAREAERIRNYRKKQKEQREQTIREYLMSTPRGRETLEMEAKAKAKEEKKRKRTERAKLEFGAKLSRNYYHKDLKITEGERLDLLLIQESRSQQENLQKEKEDLRREAEEIEEQKKLLGI